MEPWRKNLAILWSTQFVAMLGMSFIVPFLPFFIRELGVTNEDELARWSGLAFAGPFIISFFMVPIWGWLGDRYGRKLMVVRATYGLAAAQALIGLSQTVEQLFFFRMLQGSVSGFIAAALALTSATTPKDRTGYAIGVLQTATAAGTVVGPMVGGTLADAFGFRPIFFIVAGMFAINGIFVIKGVQEVRTDEGTPQRYRLIDNYKYAMSVPRIRLALVLIVAAQTAIGMVQPIFALFVESLEVSKDYLATITGVIFSIAGIFTVVSAPWWGRRADRMGYRKNLLIAFSIGGLTYIAHAAAFHALVLVPLRAVLGLCLGGIIPPLFSFISKHTQGDLRGGMMGIASSFYILANIVGPLSGGYVASHLGLRASFAVSGAILLLTTLLVWKYLFDVPERTTAVVHVDQQEVAAQ